jgi:oxygen-independent coproporphyrinogen-3 oxidase
MDGIIDRPVNPSNPGLYIHFPFCRKACHYCNFHFSTQLKHIPQIVEGIKQEIARRWDYLDSRTLGSIYLGGGTPSLMNFESLGEIFKTIGGYFKISENIEITLEVNPDDVTPERAQMWVNLPINRISLGIQSFDDKDLVYMNRAHRAKEAHRSLEILLEAGFERLTIDLIFGANTTSDEIWERNILTALSYGVQHLSCYGLTVEPKTALDYQIRRGKEMDLDDQKAAAQYLLLMDLLGERGWHHYEISNFSQPGYEAVHNRSYWNGTPYLGIGPSAHSFNGNSRQWNIADNQRYIQYLKSNSMEGYLFGKEDLSPRERYNEWLMLGLRQSKGVEKKGLKEDSISASERWILSGHLIEEKNQLILSKRGKILADKIISDLFI